MIVLVYQIGIFEELNYVQTIFEFDLNIDIICEIMCKKSWKKKKKVKSSIEKCY